MTTDPARRYRCPSCHGWVAVPARRRAIDLDDVRKTHDRACPQRGAHHSAQDDRS